MAETPPPLVAPQVQDKRVPPVGILPKNMQAWVLCSVAAVMVLVIAFSGRNAPKQRSAAPGARTPATVDPNTAKIQDYQARIEEETRKLQLEQARLAGAQQTLGHAPAPGPSSDTSVPTSRTWSGASEPGRSGATLQQEKEKREDHALFASNVALSYRRGTGSAFPEQTTPAPGAADALTKALALDGAGRPEADSPNPLQATAFGAASRATAAHDRAAAAATASTELDASRGDAPGAKAPSAGRQGRSAEADTALSQAEGKRYRLFEGTVLETVLTNRLDGSFSGPVNCMVTTPVYSHDHLKLLIPPGSRVLGEVRKVQTFGEQRLAVVFHRLIMPDGFSVSLDKLPGLSQVGETGLADQVNHHYLEIFGVSLAIGAIAGLSQANTSYGPDASAADAYRQGMAGSLSQSSLHILDRYLNVLPTVTIREGQRVKVYLSDDLLLPAYEKHQIPPDF